MARHGEPLEDSCAGRNGKAWGKREYGDQRKDGPDNATLETSSARDWSRRCFGITPGDAWGCHPGKPLVRCYVRGAVPKKKHKKHIRTIYSLDLSPTNGIFETIRRAGFGEGDIHGKQSF